MTSAFEARIARIERYCHVVRMPTNPGQARQKLAALVESAGGQLPGEPLAQATARVLGISTRELIDTLNERAAHA